MLAYGRIEEQDATLIVANLGTTLVTNCMISGSVSTLEEGVYSATDLYTGLDGGTVTVTTSGAFSNWLVDSLKANETRIFRLALLPTGVKPLKEILSLKIYPNPATTEIHIALEQPSSSGQIRVMDLTGKVINELSFIGEHCRLDTRNWKTGSYFLEVKTEKGLAVRRVVVGM